MAAWHLTPIPTLSVILREWLAKPVAMCVGDGPELSAELSARLGPRHNLQLVLGNFDVTCSIEIGSPNHINIEEGVAFIRYLRWILRAKARFRHRVVCLIDSKVVLGTISKGRSSSSS